jgi:hypothetical protein
MPRRLVRRTTPQMWVIVLLTALLFAIALALALTESGPGTG